MRLRGLVGDAGRFDRGDVHGEEHRQARRHGDGEVYASLPAAADEPPKRLVGWTKVDLGPGESKEVSVPVSRDRLTIYDEASDSWKLVPGEYVIRVGGSSRDLPLEKAISMQ